MKNNFRFSGHDQLQIGFCESSPTYVCTCLSKAPINDECAAHEAGIFNSSTNGYYIYIYIDPEA